MLEPLRRFLSFTPASKKSKMLSLISLVTITAAIPFSLYLLSQQQDIRSRAQESPGARRNTEEQKYQGYVVELKKESLVGFREKGKKEGKSVSALESEARNHKKALEEEHEQAKADILKRLGQEPEISTRGIEGGGQIVLREYDTVFNGIALNISDEQKERIKESPFVKKIHPNYQVKALLNDSVPLINTNQAWLLGSPSGPVTGRGVNIAIIDTGVDYTHPDLGETRMDEREFSQITPNSLSSDLLSYDLDQNISLNNGRIAYPSGNKIKIYSFDTQTTTEVDLFTEGLKVRRLALKGDILVYYARDEEWNVALYFNNLATSEKRKIVDTHMLTSISIADGKIIYGRAEGRGFFPANIYIYDILSAQEIPITNTENIDYIPKVWEDLIVWPVPASQCYDKAVVYDMNTNQHRDIVPPDIGPILDFKDNKILYVACSRERFDRGWKTYYLYDLGTGAARQLSYSPSPVGVGSLDNTLRSFDHGIYALVGYKSKGAIEEGIIYFSKNASASKIVAYDQELNRYVQINLLKNSGYFEAEGRRVCFVDRDYHIYCHVYSPSNSYTQPEIFNEKVVGGYNFIYNEEDPYDDNGHGTHVAAIAASNGNPKGVAPGAKVVAYKVLNSRGSGFISDVVAALERAVQTRLDNNPSDDIDVINMSLGRDCFPKYDFVCGPDDWMSYVVDRTVDAGIVVVIAAGNIGSEPVAITSPGTARKAITVGAVNKQRQIADFSSRGPITIFWGEDSSLSGRPDEIVIKPDIVAPGVGICAAKASSAPRYGRECIDDNHVSLRGTSMAAPHVAGVAALLKQGNPLWSPEDIKTAIKSNALNPGENLYQDPGTYGSGLVDARAAFSQSPSPGSTSTPSFSIYLSVKLPGIGDGDRENRSPLRRERIVYVTLRDADGRIIKTARGIINFDGTNYIGAVDLGNIYSESRSESRAAGGGDSGGGANVYSITVKLDNSLSGLVSSSPIEIRPGITTDLPPITLTTGDVNNDNVINISDFVGLRRCFFKNKESPEWPTCQTSDFNEDGRISVTDYSRLVTNFGRRGE